MKSLILTLLTPISLFMITACNPGEQSAPINTTHQGAGGLLMEYEVNYCEWTGEKIETVRYGAIINNDKSKLYFKSVECAIAWQLAMNNESDSKNLLVADFIHGKKLIPAVDAIYLQSTLRPSPGKLYISALEKSNTFMHGRVYEAYPGTFLEWDELVEFVKKEWGTTPVSPKAHQIN